MSDAPAWRQGFDAVERELAPRLEAIVRSEPFAVAVGLATRAQRFVEEEMSRATRRTLHRLNLPAGTDVSRILHEIGQLRLQMRELTAELEATRAELADVQSGSPRRRPRRAS